MDIETVLVRGVAEIIKKESIIKKLKSGKKLVIKLGIDPTGSELHLGHAVVLRKLREFQALGHQAVLVIGDFTAKIGDPSGRTNERKQITEKQIEENMKGYKKQASKILDFDKVKLVYNSQWLSKMQVPEILELASKATIAQIMERKEFKERVESNEDTPYLEMFYPLMQGYDSVALKADIELGGTDQKFNLLMGRHIQKRYEQKEQDVIILKLLTGTDGQKMSKSAENYISLTVEPTDMYGKIMSIPDELLEQYTELCTDIPMNEIQNMSDPFEFKKKLAKTIVEMYHGKKEAKKAGENFKRVFQEGKYPESQMIEFSLPANKKIKRLQIPIISGATTSTTQAKELWRNNAIEIDGKKETDWSVEESYSEGTIIKIGPKRIIKVE